VTLDDLLDKIDLDYGPPMSVFADLLRAMIVAKPGHDLLAADLSAIEGRVLAWLAGEQWKIEAYRNGGDLYKIAYGKAFNIAPDKVTKDQRQLGKVMELALGYQGGVGAFQTMARGYGVKIPDKQADELKLAWRKSNPKIKTFWYALEDAAIQAVEEPNTVVHVNKIAYRKEGSFLFCRLPSGRTLTYPYPRLKDKKMPWTDMHGEPVYRQAIVYRGTDPLTKAWTDQDFYGGLAAENVTQAVARDILAEGITRCEANGYPVVLHVHDEIVTEVPKDYGSIEELERMMSTPPPWAPDLPLAAEGWRGSRYRK
jgi:DNA polymerase